MKQNVSDHAVATGNSFIATTATGTTEMQLYECGNTGLLFALDGAWLEDQADDVPLAIPSFVDEGTAIILVDDPSEIDNTIKVVGEEHPERLIDDVIREMKHDIELGDWTAITEMLQFVPKEVLINYMGVG